MLWAVVKSNWGRKRTKIKYTIKDTRILCEKSNSGKNTESHANPLYYQGDYRRRREPHSCSVFTMTYTLFVSNCNDDASPFIEKNRTASYEITKLPLTRFPGFTGYKALRLDRFSTMHLRGATLHYCFILLLRLDASESSSRVMLRSASLEWYQAATPERDSDLVHNLKLRTPFLPRVLRSRSEIYKRDFSK